MKQPAWLTSDLPFAQEDANRYLPRVIAVMTCLTALMMAIGLTLSTVFLNYHVDYQYRVEIQIPYADGEEKEQQRRIVSELSRAEGIEKVESASDSEMQAMLEPWIGARDMLDLLPVPALVHVWMDEKAYKNGTVSAESIRKDVKSRYPDSVVDDYRQWVADFNSIAASVRQGIYSIAALLVLASVMIVLLITRASVQLHFNVVKLLHRIGAEDGYIARQFQVHAAKMTLKGAAIGALAALALFTILLWLLSRFAFPLLPDTSLKMAHVMMFVTLPALMALSVAGVTQRNVRGILRRLH